MTRVLVAVAWPYASGPRHIGHVAGFGVPSDVFARYQRLKGSDVLMVSGTDDHGTPITLTADREGVSPEEVADRYNSVIGDDLIALGLSYDLFTRTHTANHAAVTQDLFRTLFDRGYLVPRTTLGAFSASTGRTLPDRYIEGTCPICGYQDARGDQCDNCGNQLDPVDLIEPRSKVDGQPPVFRDTEHFFLDLPAFADQLAAWVEKQEHWRPNVRNFSLNFLKDLKPRAITRDIDWGVPVPLPGWEERDDKRIYVWFDAVIGYLSASVEWAAARGTPDAWREWWQDPDARHHYFMGKDNIVFHTVIWPSILLGVSGGAAKPPTGPTPPGSPVEGERRTSVRGASPSLIGSGDLELPHDVAASEFLTMEGRKFSSSRQVVIYVRDFLDRYDPDALRYYLTAAGPESQDTDFTWAEFVRRNNGELVGTWGNLVNRTLTNAYRNFGAVPPAGELTAADHRLLATVEAGFASVGDLLDGARFKAALGEAMRLAGAVNQYLSEQAPWKIMAADRGRAGTILHVALRGVDSLKVLLTPFLPFSSQRLHAMLGYTGVIAGMPRVEERAGHRVLTGTYTEELGQWQPSALEGGRVLPEPAPLFRKLDESIVPEELARMEA